MLSPSNQLWTNGPVTLYHGTLLSHAQDILNHGIELNRCQQRSDFSRGFYTTSSRAQAVTFANRKYDDARGVSPRTRDYAALLSWILDRNSLGKLENLVFVRGRDNDEYWQFVEYCWSGVTRHKPNGDYYHVVYGPVNRNYRTRRVLDDSDQISFHRDASVKVLENCQMNQETGNPYVA